jgi:hypothetical protein
MSECSLKISGGIKGFLFEYRLDDKIGKQWEDNMEKGLIDFFIISQPDSGARTRLENDAGYIHT